jgi:hypothetical protein
MNAATAAAYAAFAATVGESMPADSTGALTAQHYRHQEAEIARLTAENEQLRADAADQKIVCRAAEEGWQEELAAERAKVQAVRDLCDDPGGPDSWSHTFDGRAAIFVDDVLAAIGEGDKT